ncbi:hypothetical protein I302_101924 [Kwoniella bestiolae CBS 10118]|uniref:Uncharacterized protein n=1 Tax=Kwoniella bestiolae CBS 10118 TaxID=1296100 RepID=A0A1B9GDL3_9TREE|nr:hypothetical protein I302_00606 [Kwoniella bestiolae CBS 10118]OCF29112.1 hypothetical protein I302_00606 [Kwoniella bestiolae CBS 10118]
MSSLNSPTSDYSILSSLEVLSLSSGQPSRRASSASQLLYPATSDDGSYEDVFISCQDSPMEASSSSSVVEVEGRKSASAKRRERKKKLIAGEKERAALGIPSTRVFGQSTKENQIQIHPQSIMETPKGKTPLKDISDQTPVALMLGGPSTPRPSSSTSSSSSFVLPDEQSETDSSSNAEITRKKTRRGGRKARRRLENKGLAKEASEVDEELLDLADGDTTSPTSSARSSVSSTPVKVVVNRYTEGGPEEEDEVDQLSALESEIGTPPGHKYIGGSVMSAEDAASSIDSFLSDPRNFMTIKANKLRLWQSLCIELGLVTLRGDELPDLPTTICVPSPPRPRETTPEPALPFVPKKHPLPETLTQARKLLKDHAHVNLVDYLEARKYCPPAYVGAYQGLLYPSTSAMKRYTRGLGKFAEKNVVRGEWLEPLMKDFGVRKGKGM